MAVSDPLKLDEESNIDYDGRWVFKIDDSSISSTVGMKKSSLFTHCFHQLSYFCFFCCCYCECWYACWCLIVTVSFKYAEIISNLLRLTIILASKNGVLFTCTLISLFFCLFLFFCFLFFCFCFCFCFFAFFLFCFILFFALFCFSYFFLF